MAVGLALGLAVLATGLVVTFAGARLRGRVAGLAAMATGALLAVAASPPEPSWVVAVTVALTLVPLLALAVLLRRRLEGRPDQDTPDLDDEPR